MPANPRTLTERLAYIHTLTERLLSARDPFADTKRLSALLREELEAAQTLIAPAPPSDE